MDKKILIVKNITREGPGILQQLLDKKNISFEIVDLDQGEFFPDPRAYSALVILGGPDSANDQTQKMQTELLRIKEAFDHRIPYLGICLGLQTLVKISGGEVVKSPLKEIGFRDPDANHFTIDLTEEGKTDPLFEGLGNHFKVFHLHGETVELTPDMKLLGTGKYCKNQIARIGENAYGIQCHFELTPEMFDQWISEDPDLLKLNREELKREFAMLQEEYTRTGRQLFENFLKIAGF